MLATNELYLIFNNLLYKQFEGVAMGSLLGPSIASAFLDYHEQNLLDSYPLEYKPLYFRQYVYDIFILLKSSDYLKRFQIYLSSCHVNMSLIIEIGQNNKITFLDVNVICK